MPRNCDHPGYQPCPPHVLLYTINPVDKHTQVYSSEVVGQIQVNFHKYFTEDKLCYEFQHKVCKQLILFIQIRINAFLKHLDIRCCNIRFICPLCNVNRARQNTVQRGTLAISLPKDKILYEF